MFQYGFELEEKLIEDYLAFSKIFICLFAGVNWIAKLLCQNEDNSYPIHSCDIVFVIILSS